MKYPKLRLPFYARILFLAVLTIQILFDPVSSARHFLMISSVRSKLPQAHATWDSLGIADYTFEIQGSSPPICQPSAVVEVRDGVVVKVELKNSLSGDLQGQLLPPEKWADPDWKDEDFLCSYYHFTMPQIFDFLENTIEKHPSTVMDANFDSLYGFVSRFEYGIYVGYGLLRPRISECCNYFVIKNFQPLTQ